LPLSLPLQQLSGPLSTTLKLRHFDRSVSQSHREARSGEIPHLPLLLPVLLLSSRRDLLLPLLLGLAVIFAVAAVVSSSFDHPKLRHFDRSAHSLIVRRAVEKSPHLPLLLPVLCCHPQAFASAVALWLSPLQ
jgi:hypothetical protein